jgi:hypothetical protein
MKAIIPNSMLCHEYAQMYAGKQQTTYKPAACVHTIATCDTTTKKQEKLNNISH